MFYTRLIVLISVWSLGYTPVKSRVELSALIPDTQVTFLGPEGMTVAWDIGGCERYDSETLVVPRHHIFPQGFVYGLKLANIPGHPGVELYQTLEVVLAESRTRTFLKWNAVSISFGDEDIDAVLSGKFVTKVTYLPAPEFQEVALPVETIVSYRLDPGADPITEAARRGDVVVILRIEPRATSAKERCIEAQSTPACRLARFTERLRCRFRRR